MTNLPREHAALIGRAVLALGITPLMFIIYMATGVPGIPGLDVKSPSANGDRGDLVFVAQAAAPVARPAAREPQAVRNVRPQRPNPVALPSIPAVLPISVSLSGAVAAPQTGDALAP